MAIISFEGNDFGCSPSLVFADLGFKVCESDFYLAQLKTNIHAFSDWEGYVGGRCFLKFLGERNFWLYFWFQRRSPSSPAESFYFKIRSDLARDLMILDYDGHRIY